MKSEFVLIKRASGEYLNISNRNSSSIGSNGFNAINASVLKVFKVYLCRGKLI